MEQEIVKKQLLYIGNDDCFIEALKQSLAFQVVSFPNALLTVNWLTKNKFVPFSKETQNCKFENRPYSILCESNLLGMSGFDFYDELKQNADFNKIPFILVKNKFR